MRIERKLITAPEDAQGARLDAWLAARFPVLSRNEWQQRIDGGHVTLNGRQARASRRLNFGDRVEFSYTMRDEPEVPTDIGILYEDTDYLVVNKPPGLPVHPSGIYKTRTVTTLLVARNVVTEPYLLHRLDRETSGVLVLARNRRAAALFQKILRQGQIEKTYLVAVEGKFVNPLDAAGFIYRLPDSRLPRQRFFSANTPPANALEVQHCRTLLKPVEHRAGISLVEATLLTGRMHQIRATMHSLGYPVIGDKLYGLNPALYFTFADEEMTAADWQRLRIARSALHCNRMRLQHPVTGTDWALEAPLPEDMAALFRQ
ncbi:MAG: RluA family pseudouridine synthase [Turneriella sp.]